LNILIVTQYFWPENFKINDFALGLSKRGHKITVLTGFPNYPEGKLFEGYSMRKSSRYVEKYKHVTVMRSFLLPRGAGSGFRLLINYISFAISASVRILKLKDNFDLIFVYEPSPITVCIPAIILKKRKKTPIIMWVTDLWPESIRAASKINNGIIEKLLNPLVTFIYHSCNSIFVTSKGFISSIVDRKIGIDKIHYFPQWAEPIFKPIFTTKPIISEIPNNSFKIIFAGNIGEAQDFPSILKAAQLLKNNINIHWIIIGSGRKENWLKDQLALKNLENNFHMAGRYDLKKMPKIYSTADAMLLSLRDEHIFSLTIPAKLQSYMACGKPILGMVNGEVAKIIEEANAGLTCSSGDFEGLVKNVLKMSTFSDRELKKLSDNSINFYEANFNRGMLFKRAEYLFYQTIKSFRN